jgi:hypothetical protein
MTLPPDDDPEFLAALRARLHPIGPLSQAAANYLDWLMAGLDAATQLRDPQAIVRRRDNVTCGFVLLAADAESMKTLLTRLLRCRPWRLRPGDILWDGPITRVVGDALEAMVAEFDQHGREPDLHALHGLLTECTGLSRVLNHLVANLIALYQRHGLTWPIRAPRR